MGRLEDDIRDASRGRLVPGEPSSPVEAERESARIRKTHEVEKRFDKVSEQRLKDEANAEGNLARGSRKETLSDLPRSYL